MSMPNEALQKLLLEIEQKASFSQQQMVIVKSQIDVSKREIRMIDLMDKEIKSLPSDAKLYDGVGKMFVASPSSLVNERLAKEKSAHETKLKDLDKKFTFLETTFKNSQAHLDQVYKNGGR